MIARALPMLSDERLAQLAAAGSDPAFATLYGRYSGTLFGYCRSITRNADDGWDALQNAMVKVLVALRRSERTAPVRPWLFCIAHNEAVGVLRRRSAADRVVGASMATATGSSASGAGADEQAEIRELMTETVSDVQQLPTSQRAALVMRELGGLAYDEIAIALETTEGNARQLVFAARTGLRDSRAGRGLPCESVRDQLSLADGRLLRRRSVRAHLRTCDACRHYAVSVRRRSGQPVSALSAWSPLAAWELLQTVLRAGAAPGGAALSQSGSSLVGGIAVKAVAVTAMVATGIGAADVATLRTARSSRSAAAGTADGGPARRPSRRAPRSHPVAAGSRVASAGAAASAPTTVAAVYPTGIQTAHPRAGRRSSAMGSAGAGRTPAPTRDASPQPAADRSPRTPARANCDTASSSQAHQSSPQPAATPQHDARTAATAEPDRQSATFTGAQPASGPDQAQKPAPGGPTAP